MSEATSTPASPNAPAVTPGVTPPAGAPATHPAPPPGSLTPAQIEAARRQAALASQQQPESGGVPTQPTQPTPAPVVKPVTVESRLEALETRVFGGPAPAPNHEIIVGDTMTIPIAAWDADEKIQPLLPGDTFTARSSNANMLEVGITAVSGGPAVVVTGRHVAEGIVAIVENAKGLRSASERFNVIAAPPAEPPVKEVKPDPAPVALVLMMDKAVVTDGMAAAQKSLADQGYTKVTPLLRGSAVTPPLPVISDRRVADGIVANDSVWRGQATTKDGRMVNVAVDSRGFVSET